MKNHMLLLMAGALVLASCAKGLPARVDYPLFSYSNTQTIRISGVERTDTATVVSVHAEFIPHYWIRVAPETQLVAGEKAYPLTGADGMVPGELFWMPDSGEADFTLFFEPLDPETRKVDFIEGDEPRAFRIYDIDLTADGAAPKLKYPSRIGQPDLKGGQTTVTVDMSFRKEFIGQDVTLYVNTVFPAESMDYTAAVGEDGKARFTFWHNGPAGVFLAASTGRLVVNPGESVTIFPEGAQWRKGDAFKAFRSENGRFSHLTTPTAWVDYAMNVRNGSFAPDVTTGAEYMAYLKNAYDQKVQALAASGLSAYEKEYIGLSLKGEVCAAVNEVALIREYHYRSTHDNSLEGYVPLRFEEEDYTWLRDLGLDDTRIYLVNSCNNLFKGPVAGQIYGEEDNFHTEKARADALLKKVQDGLALDDEDRAALAAFRYPMFRDGIVHLQQEMEAAAANMPEGVRDVPEVPEDQLLDAILARYAGKPVLVDIWATWCGPCRAAHKQLEPLKDTDYKDVQFVYLTSTTSPHPKWLDMIRSIRGDHYYLSEEQLSTIFTQLESNAFPTYLVVGRDGTRKGRFIGYNADEVKKALDSAR